MSISDLGSLGEFFSSLAVLATLIYIAIQTRQSRLIAVSEAARAMSTDFLSFFSTLSFDRDTTALLRRALHDWDALTDEERSRAHVFFSSMMVHYLTMFGSNHPELRAAYTGWENNLLGMLRTPGGQRWWIEAKYLWTGGARERLEHRLADPATLPPPWTDASWWHVVDSEPRA